jgi:error-prone DNA polymerase
MSPATALAVRIGLGYVTGVREDDARALVEMRERGGPYADLGELASRSGLGRDGLERLAWAGASAPLRRAGSAADGSRRRDLWAVGVARGTSAPPGQLSLPLPIPEPPRLRELSTWETIVADYASTAITLGEHPMALIRPSLEEGLVRSEGLARLPSGTSVRVAGMVVARQRPSTARGVVFMLLEDEVGVINLVVLPPAYRQHRLAVRTASFVEVAGVLERRDGVINVVARSVETLATPDMPPARIRHIEPPSERETGRPREEPADEPAVAAAAAGAPAVALGSRQGELAAVAPKPHSFGRRGR